ncbi:DUF6527 family protein [Mesorhizobium sp. WSM2561]|uniref:DUF6527 family protein n=1 Tax=Mesorhizobium sp. WSM2561 TaxID=1040985 RepID=UPI0006856C25|nr:DUF6527 family protein [Mesorhizobium sp. WSM2561]
MSREQISLKAEVTSRVGAAELIKEPGDAVLVVRGTPRWLLLRCPCGCGEEIPINLDHRAGKAWRLYEAASEAPTVFPSVWRDTGCESHFVIWRGHILMFGLGRKGYSPREALDLATLGKRVLSAWPASGLASYVDVADRLREIPWDVLEACQDLVAAGVLTEGEGQQRGTFERR